MSFCFYPEVSKFVSCPPRRSANYCTKLLFSSYDRLDNVSIQGKEPNVDSFSNTQSGNANVEKDNLSIQGKEPNVDSFSNTQSSNAIERQTVRKSNVGKSYSHNVSESSATPSHNVTTKKNIKRKTFASNVSSGNVKRKKSVPKSTNRSGSVSESSAAQSGTVGRTAARTNTTQTQSGTVGRSAARTVNTTQTQSGTVGRSGSAGRSSAHTASSSSYTRSGNGTKRRSSMPKVKTTRVDSAIEKQTIRRRTKHSWTVDIIINSSDIVVIIEWLQSDIGGGY
ncbi:hypothetical protein ACFE04_010274 [Oxalis oulophora]